MATVERQEEDGMTRVLFFDLETAPSLAYVWHPTDDYVPSDRLIHPNFLLTWAAKWAGDRKVSTGRLTPDEARAQDDSRIVESMAALIREADIVVAHNVAKFDLPTLNARLLLLGLEPLGPVRTIDTLTLARKSFRLPYSKLDYLGEVLGLGRKLKTDFDLWRNAYHGDERALAKMLRYNRQDVVLLERVFDRLLPYVKNLPRLVEAAADGEMVCPTCASAQLQRRGTHKTNACTYQQYQCQECKRYCRARLSEKRRLGVHPL